MSVKVDSIFDCITLKDLEPATITQMRIKLINHLTMNPCTVSHVDARCFFPKLTRAWWISTTHSGTGVRTRHWAWASVPACPALTEMAGLLMAEDGWWKQRWQCHTTSTRTIDASLHGITINDPATSTKMSVVGGLPFTGTTVLAFPSLPGCPAKHVTWAATMLKEKSSIRWYGKYPIYYWGSVMHPWWFVWDFFHQQYQQPLDETNHW